MTSFSDTSVDVMEFNTAQVDEDERLFQQCLEVIDRADLVLLRLHGGLFNFKKGGRLIEHARMKGAELLLQSNIPEDNADVKDLFHHPEEDRRLLSAYLELGGEENEAAVVAWALNRIGVMDVPLPRPRVPKAEGLYHPGLGSDVTMDEYRARLSPDQPTIGILFHQGLYLSADLAGIDALINELEGRGANVIAVFFTSAPNQVTGARGIRDTIEHYFMSEGRPAIDVLVMNTGFSQLVLSDPGDGSVQEAKDNFFQRLGVPVIQAINTYQTGEEWVGNDGGLTFFELSTNVVWPEYDGQIITFPIASSETDGQCRRTTMPISERIRGLANMAILWARLRRTPVTKRKVAILLHQNPPRNDTIGDAFGLDAPASTVQLLHAMQKAGYSIEKVPENGNELVFQLLAGVSNDSEWLSADQMRERAAGVIGKELYSQWFEKVATRTQFEMVRDWGKPPGEQFCIDSEIVVPGVKNGNVFIGLQPPRSDLLSSEKNYHSTDLVMPHNYLAYYKWIEYEFGADVVIHMGCHGTLEWLPGKSVGLSEDCCPDAVLGHVPHLYPYIVGNPGEGIQAKRRSYAVIVDHLPPALTRAELYPDLSTLEADVQAYLRANAGGEREKLTELKLRIMDASARANILADIGADGQVFEEMVPRLYDYLNEVKDSLIKDGLHILGKEPEGARLVEMVYSITRLCNGSIPSLRDGIAHGMGLNIRSLQDDPSAINSSGETNGELIDRIDAEARGLIQNMGAVGFRPDDCSTLAASAFPNNEMVNRTVRFISQSLVPDIRRSTEEIISCLDGMDGGYVPPGPSGTISRGNAHILPTGRNFYSIDPQTIPTPASWEVGRKMADQMVDRHVRENGSYPESVGIVIFATDTMKTGGDDIAYILWLMGLRPKWVTNGGKVLGLEVIPVKELGRPRIDVTLRISGLFRDSFPNLVEMIDEGVQMIADQDESEEDNYLKKHLRADIVESVKAGMKKDEARQKALIRIFGDPPRTYGGGVDQLIGSSKWNEVKDLGSIYVEWGGHAYGKGKRGEKAQETFAKRLGELDVTVKNHSSRELDILDNDDDYIFHGGMVAAVKTYGGEAPLSIVGDGSDPNRPRLRTVGEEASFVFRSRVLNPKWLEGLKEHGYRGARELSSLMDFVFGWDATSDVIEPWMYEGMAEKFLFDEETKRWLEENNPEVIRQMSARMLEAINRGMWDANASVQDRLESMYLEQEEKLEGEGP